MNLRKRCLVSGWSDGACAREVNRAPGDRWKNHDLTGARGGGVLRISGDSEFSKQSDRHCGKCHYHCSCVWNMLLQELKFSVWGCQDWGNSCSAFCRSLTPMFQRLLFSQFTAMWSFLFVLKIQLRLKNRDNHISF